MNIPLQFNKFTGILTQYSRYWGCSRTEVELAWKFIRLQFTSFSINNSSTYSSAVVSSCVNSYQHNRVSLTKIIHWNYRSTTQTTTTHPNKHPPFCWYYHTSTISSCHHSPFSCTYHGDSIGRQHLRRRQHCQICNVGQSVDGSHQARRNDDGQR